MSISHVEIIGLWDTTAQLAEAVGVKASGVRKWKQRGKVPSEHWPALVRAAKARGERVTIDMLAATQPARKTAA